MKKIDHIDKARYEDFLEEQFEKLQKNYSYDDYDFDFSEKYGFNDLPYNLDNRKVKKYEEGEDGFLIQNDEEININDLDFMLGHISNDYPCLDEASKELRKNKQLVLSAVQVWPDNFIYASKELRNDIDVLINTIGESYNRDFLIFDHLDEEIKDNEEFFIEYLKAKIDYDWTVIPLYSNEISWASDRLKNNKDFAKKICAIQGRAIKDFSDDIQNDYEVALIAVNAGAPLRVLKFKFRDDKEIVKSAIINTKTNDGDQFDLVELVLNLQDMDKDLLLDSAFVEELKKARGDIVKYLPKEFKEKYDEYLNDLSLLRNIPEKLSLDRNFWLDITQRKAKALDYCPQELRKDADFMLELLKSNVDIKNSIPINLRINFDFISKAKEYDPSIAELYIEKKQK